MAPATPTSPFEYAPAPESRSVVDVRSSYGLYIWGESLGMAAWTDRALATRDLHLAAPQDRGLFPTVFVFGDGPEGHRWVGSHHQGGGPGIYHLFDNFLFLNRSFFLSFCKRFFYCWLFLGGYFLNNFLFLVIYLNLTIENSINKL